MHPRPPEVELLAVKAELDLAKKTIDRYAHLVTKLYDELDTLRNGICNMCKTKFVLGAASSSSSAGCSSSPCPSPRSIPLSPQTTPGNAQTDVISDLRNAETPTTQTPREPAFVPPSVTEPQTSAAVDDIAKPDEADWSVIHNHEAKQTLDIHLAHTLKMKSGVNSVQFSRGGKYLAVGLGSGEAYVYDMKTLSYRLLTIVEYPVKEQPTIRARFSPDEKYIATGAGDGHIRIWNIAEKRLLAMFEGHTSVVISVDFSPDSRFLLSGSWDGSVRIWCMRDGSSKKLLDNTMFLVMSSAISPDGRYIAAADYYGMLRIWDFRSGQLLHKWKSSDRYLWAVVFTTDGKGVLGAGKDKILRHWDISLLLDGQLGSSRGELNEKKNCLSFHGHTDIIMSISTFCDGQRVMSSSCDTTVRIWDTQTVAWECTLNGHQATVRAAHASPDGNHLATGSDDGLVRIWRYEQAK